VAHRLRGRISCLKHRFGWDRTRMDGLHGARIWCRHGVFAHNLVKIGGLLEAKHNTTA
jgi:transposase, IS5 family